ncbi:MAG: type II secretion system protein [Verrucomicrobiales bacterium]|nr:type II secretion system protein [Verrucomicrobiales bacterium]
MKPRFIQGWLLAATLLSGAMLCRGDEANVAQHFPEVVSHLDTGGQSFCYAEKVPGSTSVIQTIMDLALAAPMPEGTPDFKAGMQLLQKALRLDAVKATGESGVYKDGLTHSRTFRLVPDGVGGLSGLFGATASPYLSLEFPAEADLAAEIELDLRQVAGELMAGLPKVLPPDDAAKFKRELDSPQGNAPFTPRQLLENSHLRLALGIWVYEDQKIALPNSPQLPGADALLALQHAGWLLKPMIGQLSKQFQGNPAVEIVQEGQVITATFRQPIGPPPTDFQPILRYDGSRDLLWVASRPALLEAAGEVNGLGKDARFVKATNRLPLNGNSLVFVSDRMLRVTANVLKSTAEFSPAKTTGDEEARKLIQSALQWLDAENLPSQAWALAVEQNGIFTASNTVFLPSNDSGTLATASTIAILASIAAPVAMQVKTKAVETRNASNARQLIMALKVYAADNNGSYPPDLEALFKQDILDESSRALLLWVHPRTGATQPWIYSPGLNDSSPADTVIISSPKVPNTRQVLGKNDGSIGFAKP